MTETTPKDRSEFALFVCYWRALARQTGASLVVALGLLVLLGVMEGGGLLLLTPLLQSLGLGPRGSPATWLNASALPSTLPLLLLVFVGLKAGQSGLRAWSSILNQRLESDFTCFLRDRFYRAMMQANWLYLTRQRSSDFTQALMEELPLAGNGVQSLLSFLSMLVLAIVNVAVALAISPGLTALAIGSGATLGFIVQRFRARAFVMGKEGQGKRAEIAAAVSEHLAGLKIAKSQGRDERHFTHFQQAMKAIASHSLKLGRIRALSRIWTEVGAVTAFACFAYFAVEVRHVNSAQLLVLAFIFMRLLSHASSLQGVWHDLLRALPSYAATERLRERCVAEAEVPPDPASAPLPLQRALCLEQVTFRYAPELPPAVSHVSLIITARKITALCGSSGAGKSTLADLALGLLAPTSGQVLVDGVELSGARLHDWRKSVGYVPQETFLFHESIRENLLWARPTATEPELRAALRAAAAEAFVDLLPKGLDTIVGDRGIRLSGGERQRIALARAILRRPALLVLDEATSALDTPNERIVQEAIDRLQGELTILIIAHRLSTLRRADRIVVLEAGEIAEAGTWDELYDRSGSAFRRLAAANSIL